MKYVIYYVDLGIYNGKYICYVNNIYFFSFDVFCIFFYIFLKICLFYDFRVCNCYDDSFGKKLIYVMEFVL